jgi:hypothetical protein
METDSRNSGNRTDSREEKIRKVPRFREMVIERRSRQVRPSGRGQREYLGGKKEKTSIRR